MSLTTQKSLRSSDRTGSKKRPARWFARAAAIALSLAIIWAAISFSAFVRNVDAMASPTVAQADGIVVVTGGAGRIEAALNLLQRGAAERLLISGVYPSTDTSSLVARTDSDPNLFSCCVDLDRAALDTAGNAREAASWADSHRYGSLLVVTSAYHMPRTVRELSAQLPGVELIAYPVNAATADAEPSAASARWPLTVLAREYIKLQLSNLRHFMG